MLAIDFEKGAVVNESRDTRIAIAPLPALMREIISLGGGIGFMHQRLREIGA
jgi:hypothetical protein